MFDTDEFVEKVAAVYHEVSRAYHRALGTENIETWDVASEPKRQAAIEEVRFVISHPHATAATKHESWMAKKRADGWSFGPYKDLDTKKDPRFISYHLLPQEQRVKEYIALAVVRSIVEQFCPVEAQG